jgi:hypothetical protein
MALPQHIRRKLKTKKFKNIEESIILHKTTAGRLQRNRTKCTCIFVPTEVTRLEHAENISDRRISAAPCQGVSRYGEFIDYCNP